MVGWQVVQHGQHWQGRFSAMASPVTVLVEGGTQADLSTITPIVAAEISRIEALWSRYRSDNIVARINQANGQPVEVDTETTRLLDYAAHLHQFSQGLLDISTGVLRKAWRFDGSDRLPSPDSIAALLPLVGWDKLRWQAPFLTLPVGMELDFGALGKEYAVDRALHLACQHSTKAVLVNAGGDIAASRGSQPWQVGVEGSSAHIALGQGGIATSGDAYRYLLHQGQRYGHILHPHTGWPVLGAPKAVTVCAETCSQAGVLSTLALLHGAQAEAFLHGQGVRFYVQW